ncbi:hypothetical protein ZYGR_0AK03230 [Zygosaccharomyces rouxii]|uniref:Protein kinase domain-containing protein n=1 Tax=Zygosaccharomyces rouxii TaxID=4956 RepID=A0A1Q3ADS8_ZYGRO|nr:hypothetical protein ZYGR_0AK03230 [Zygosaccharomyces rouxii]
MASAIVSKAHSVPWLAVEPRDHTTKCKYATKGGQLGDGNFSVVRECMNLYTRNLYALKMVHKVVVRDKIQLVKEELKLLAEISKKIKELEAKKCTSMNVFEGHHHILQLFDYFETDESIGLVMQLCDRGDLYEKIIAEGHLDIETQVKSFTACLVSVLEFLHGQGVVHRDIKAENVLFRLRVNKNEPVESQGKFPYDLTAHDLILADFGFATNIGPGTQLRAYVGTLSYIAPEIVRCKNINYMSEREMNELKPYGFPVDVWALGVLTYFMALGYMPFDCDDDNETLECIVNQDYYVDANMENDPRMSDFWSFIQMCFRLDDSQRPNAAELKRHPFIRDYFATSTTLNQALFIPHSMKRSESSRSLKAPRKSSSYTNITYVKMDPPFSVSMTPANSGPIVEPEVAASRQRDLMQVRNTLKRTLSASALNRELVFLPEVIRGLKKNSTFVLGPQPPPNSLMNGCYSTSPQSRSTLNTPISISRATSSTSFTVMQDTGKTPNYSNDEDEDEGIVI